MSGKNLSMSWIITMRHKFLTPNLPVSILLGCKRRTIVNTISTLTQTYFQLHEWGFLCMNLYGKGAILGNK